jgi:peptide/nickel transport system substrate-binding protein
MAANDRYIFGRPKIDEIEVRFIENLNSMMVNLLAGEIEIVLGRGLSLDQGVQVRDQWRDGRLDLGFVSLVAVYPQHLDPTPTIVANAQFKRALLTALDRQAMVESIVYDLEPVADSFFEPHRPEYPFIANSVVKYPYEPRRAEQMIAELGYKRGTDGFFEAAPGQRLSIEVATGLGGEAREKSVLAIADYWQRVGVATSPAMLTQQEDRDRNYRAGGQQAFYVVRGPTDFETLAKFHSKKIPLPENRFTGGNLARYGNPQFDALLDRFEVTIRKPERMQVLAQIVDHMTSQVVVMGLFHDADVVPISKRLQKAEAQKGIGATTAWNVQEWDLE